MRLRQRARPNEAGGGTILKVPRDNLDTGDDLRIGDHGKGGCSFYSTESMVENGPGFVG